MTVRSVVLFAHNEAAAITGAINAVRKAGLRPTDTLTVLINGSTDQTLALVQAEALRDPRIIAVNIALGDKANAWDVYVHRLGDPGADMHIFIDGDVRISPGALDHIEQTMQTHPAALAIATLPRGGRQAVTWAARIMANSGLPGNFYALPGPVFRRLQGQIWLPVGFMGDDSLLRWLLLRDLDPKAAPHPNRIKPCATAFFDYDSFPRNSLAGLRRLWRRHLGYTRRELQVHVLCNLLVAQGISALPRRISEIYNQINPLHDSQTAKVGFKGRRLLLPFVALSLRRHRSAPPPEAPAWFDMGSTATPKGTP